MNRLDILKEPYLSEKGILLKDKQNKLVFKVSFDSNKPEIKKAIENAFKVTVEKIQTIYCKGKIKRGRRGIGKRSDWKKAIITLKKGDKIEYFEGT